MTPLNSSTDQFINRFAPKFPNPLANRRADKY
jgi:hypothetical protein